MKKLSCETCGATDLTKYENLYICKYCGTRYQTEDIIKKKSNKNSLKEKCLEYKMKSEEIIRKIETFENAVFIHGEINNTIAISNMGYIVLHSYENTYLIEPEDFINIQFGLPKKDDFPHLFYCIVNSKKHKSNELKMLLTVENPEKAADKYFKINLEIEKYKNMYGKTST